MSRLKRTATLGCLWQGLGLLGSRGAVLLASIVFARYVTKEDFGVLNAALAITVFVEMLRVGGVLQALIAHQGHEDRVVPTVYTLALSSGLLWTGILILSAPVAGTVLDSPRLVAVLQVMALGQMLDSFRLVPYARLMRAYKFAQQSISDASGALIGVAAGIVSLSYFGPEDRVWSLVTMHLSRVAASVLITNILCPTIPKLAYERNVAREITKRGYGILMSNIPSSLLESFSRAAVNWRVGDAAAGVFGLANGAITPAALVGHAANNTLFPILANHANDPERLRSMFVRSVKSIGMATAGLVALMIVVMPDALPIVFSEKWRDAVLPAQILALGAFLRIFTFISTNAMLAVGKPVPAATVWLSALAGSVIAFAIAPMTHGDPIPPCVVIAAVAAAASVIGMVSASREFQVPAGQLALVTGQAALPAVLGGGVGLALLQSGFLESQPWIRLLTITILFALVFLPVCGKIMGGGWLSLFSLSGARALIRMN